MYASIGGEGPLKSRYVIDRLVGHCVNRYIAVSEANGRYLAEEKGLPHSKVMSFTTAPTLSGFMICT